MTASAASLRADEARYRARGKYELAVQYQRQADLVEAGGDAARCFYSVFDRGALGPIVWGAVGHLTGFELPSGLAWALTTDRMEELFVILVRELGLTPEHLCQVALAMAGEERLREVIPRFAKKVWEQGWEANEDGEDRNPYSAAELGEAGSK